MFKSLLHHHAVGKIDARYKGQDRYGHDDLIRSSCRFFIRQLHFGKFNEPSVEVSRQCDENRIDQIEVECTQHELRLSGCNAITDGTQRRHQCGGDRNPCKDIAFVAECHGYGTRHPSEQGDEYIIEIGRSARQQFSMRIIQRSNQKVDRGCEQTRPGGEEIIPRCRFQQ